MILMLIPMKWIDTFFYLLELTKGLGGLKLCQQKVKCGYRFLHILNIYNIDTNYNLVNKHTNVLDPVFNTA